MSSLASAPLAGALRARLAAKSPASTGSTRAATVRPARASARDEEGALDGSPERALARFAVAAAASVAVALPAHAAAPVAQVALSVDEQIAAEVAKYDGMKASCKNEACRVTTQSWEDAAVKKIKKKNGIATEKPKGQAYPSAPKTAAAPAPKIAETAPEAPATPAPTPKAEVPPAEAKAEAKARLAERQAASAAAAEAAAAEKAAKAAAAKQAAEDAAAEKAAAIKAKAAEAEAAKQAKAQAKEAPKAAPAPKAAAAKPAPAKKAAPAAKKPAVKSASPVDAALGDAVVLALAGGAGIALAKPSVKDKALGGDVAAALDEAKALVVGTEGVVGKAAAAGAVVAADAAAHLPVLGFLLPGPLEYVGACAAALLAARYYVTKDATAEEDLASFGARLPSDVPSVDDVVVPAGAVFKSLSAFASDFDFEKTKGDVTEWFNALEDPVEQIAPPAAALFVANLIVYAAHFPVVSVFAPRGLELAGVAVAIAAVEKYGNTGAKFQEDLGRYATRGGDAIKQLIEK